MTLTSQGQLPSGKYAYTVHVVLNQQAPQGGTPVIVERRKKKIADIMVPAGEIEASKQIEVEEGPVKVRVYVDNDKDPGKSSPIVPVQIPVAPPASTEVQQPTHTTNVSGASQHRNTTHTEGQTAQGKALAAAKAKLKKMEKALAAANKRTQAGQEAVPPIPVVNPTSPAQPTANASRDKEVPPNSGTQPGKQPGTPPVTSSGPPAAKPVPASTPAGANGSKDKDGTTKGDPKTDSKNNNLSKDGEGNLRRTRSPKPKPAGGQGAG